MKTCFSMRAASLLKRFVLVLYVNRERNNSNVSKFDEKINFDDADLSYFRVNIEKKTVAQFSRKLRFSKIKNYKSSGIRLSTSVSQGIKMQTF